ncbi:MAG: YjiH family protein [Chitinispirillaceae bacterium]|nr:YjiH family protein [Chitinispirillaceae bacterium]
MEANAANESGQKDVGRNSSYSLTTIIKFVGLSVLGVFLFFTPVTIKGVKSIPLDHFIIWINEVIPWFGPVFTVIIVIIGGILPWVQKSYRKNALSLIMALLRTLGIPFAVLGALSFLKIATIGPEWLMKPGMLPFLFEKIVVAVTLIVPIGSIFLTFLICFGLLEFVGILVNPVMRPVFKTPGKSAINAVAAFIGSFSVAIFFTNKLYNEGKYTKREAIVIMSGFSTVSATFMVIVAKTARLMDMWNFYFWSALVITFIVTALTVRLWPIRKMENSYKDGVTPVPEEKMPGNIFKNALGEGLKTARNSPPLLKSLWENLKSGINMIFVLSPSMSSIGLIAFILVKMTSVFDIVGFIFVPFTLLLSLFGLPEPMVLAKACSAILAEMFVPNILVAGLPMAVKYVVAVTSVSSVLFFAGPIPCILASDVEFKPSHMLAIWFERTALSIILSGMVGLIVFGSA